MKKIKNIKVAGLMGLIGFLLLGVGACTKEILFVNDFNFEVVAVSNDKLLANVDKYYAINLIDVVGKDSTNIAYSMKYEIVKGVLKLKIGDVEVAPDTYTELPINYKKGVVILNCSSLDIVELKITIKDSHNNVKEKNVQLSVGVNNPIVDFPYTPLDVIQSTDTQFKINVSNLFKNNTYQMMFTSVKGATIKTGIGAIIPLNTYFDIKSISDSYTFSYYTNQSKSDIVTVYVKDQDNQIVSKTLAITINGNSPTINYPVAPIDQKELISSNFQIRLGNLFSTSVYRMKIESKKQAEIKDASGGIIDQSNYFNIESLNKTYTFSYLTNQSLNDEITITIIDQNNDIVSSNLMVNVNPKPVVVNVSAFYNNYRVGSLGVYNYKSERAHNIDKVVVGVGCTISEYSFIDYTDSSLTVEKDKSNLQSSNWGGSHSFSWGGFPYVVKVKDNLGRWSEPYKGVWKSN